MNTFHQIIADDAPYYRSGRLMTVSILSIVYYAARLTLLQPLDRNVDPFGARHSGVSTYELQMNRAFLVLGLGGMVVTTGLYLAAPAAVRLPAGLALLGTWAAAIDLAGIFPFDMATAQQTDPNTIYDFVYKNSLCIAAAVGFMANRLKVT